MRYARLRPWLAAGLLVGVALVAPARSAYSLAETYTMQFAAPDKFNDGYIHPRAIDPTDETVVGDYDFNGYPAALEVYPTLGTPEKRDALNTLAGRLSSARALRAAFEKNLVSKGDFPAAVIRQLADHHNAELTAWVEKEWGLARPTPEARSREIVSLRRKLLAGPPGDPSRGRVVFARTCQQCQRSGFHP